MVSIGQPHQPVGQVDVFHQDIFGQFHLQIRIGKVPNGPDPVLHEDLCDFFGIFLRKGQRRDLHIVGTQEGGQIVHMSDLQFADLCANQFFTYIEQTDDLETAAIEVLVIRNGLSQMTGTDDDHPMFLIQSKDLADLIAKEPDIVAIALLSESTEMIQVLSDLGCGHPHQFTQLSGRDPFDSGLQQFSQIAVIARQTLNDRFGDFFLRQVLVPPVILSYCAPAQYTLPVKKLSTKRRLWYTVPTMILSCQNIQKSYGADVVLRDVSFHLNAGERAALIGANGAGKTTLLHILEGSETADSGIVSTAKQIRIGSLAQYQDLEADCTILEEVQKARQHLLTMEADLRRLEQDISAFSGDERERALAEYETLTQRFERESGYASASEITGVLRGLGFSEEDYDRTLSTLSGGQKARVVLARLLLESPDLLFLDEPTNHLDVDALLWLEERLSRYTGTLLLVSHDRYFLDRIADHVIEIEDGRSLSYKGNYTTFREKKKALQSAAVKAYEKQQAEIKHQEDVIRKLRSFNREKSIRRAESREKVLDKIDRLDRPVTERDGMHLHFRVREESGKEVLLAEGLSKRFSDTPLFSDVSLTIRRGERVALLGENGTGKSTLLKILDGRLDADSGTVDFGVHVTAGTYDQEQQLLTDSNSLFEEIHDAYPTMTETAIRTALAAFLFKGDDVFKKVSVLSGGERARLSLAKLMLSGANLLILDEPTNHLDIPAREVLEDALLSYDGTVLFVSHDRYFINRLATRILSLQDGRLLSVDGNYDAWRTQQASGSAAEGPRADSDAKTDWKKQKEEQAALRKQAQRIAECETRIAECEARDKEIDALFLLPETGTDLTLCQQLSAEQIALREELETLYETWEELSSL